LGCGASEPNSEKIKMKRTLKSLVTAGAIGLASLMSMKAEAQVHGSVEYIQSEKSENSYSRLNLFYGLPEDVRGFSFIELYDNGDGYFGRTSLDRKITDDFGVRMHVLYVNEPISKAGFGLNWTPSLSENASARVSLLPLWIGNEGGVIGDRMELQYAGRVDLPLGFNLSGFGILDLLAGKKSPQWTYGEFELTQNLGPFKIGYNPVLLNKRGVTPDMLHRLIAGIRF